METRGVTAAVNNDAQVVKDTPPAAVAPPQRQKLKQPGVSYRATLQKLSNTISLSSAEILERYEKSEPSLILHFHANHWKFENQDGMFLYNSPARQILESIRYEQIPVDCLEVFRDVKIRYYEGCLILRLVDHRQEPPTTMHTALRPSPESLWTEMLLYSEQTQGNFTDAKALQVESDILVATNPPLDLRPSPHPDYSAGLLRDMKDPPLPRLKRKRESLHVDDEEERLLYLYDERHGREFAPDFKRLAFVEAHRKKKQLQQQRAQANATDTKQASSQPAGLTLTNGLARKTSISHSPSVKQNTLPQSSPLAQQLPLSNAAATQLAERTNLPTHLQSRPSASPQPGPRQLLNQQALAQHIAQQNQSLQNGAGVGSPRVQPQSSSNSPQVQSLAHQQQIMLQQRAMAVRNINAARAAQAQAAAQGQTPRANGHGTGQLGQGTPTPLQMQQIRQMQAQQQQQQLLAAQQQAAQNAQYQQMR